MSYYTIVDKCPSCNHLQERWVINATPDYNTIAECEECSIQFDLTQTIYKIKFREDPAED